MADVAELIHPGLIDLNLDTANRDDAIRRLAGLLDADGRLSDAEAYVGDVLRREQEAGGTGMEVGVAIPHAKSAGVRQAGLVFARASRGIDFGSDDAMPADLVFLIAAPDGEDRLHVQVLSRLARRLIHASFRDALREADSAEDAVAIIQKEVSA